MEIPRHWRLKKQRYALVGEECPHCQAKLFPPRDVCPECGKEAKEPYAFSGKGTVFSFTVMHDAPSGYEPPPPTPWRWSSSPKAPSSPPSSLTWVNSPSRSACRSRWSHASCATTAAKEACWCTGISSDRFVFTKILSRRAKGKQIETEPNM